MKCLILFCSQGQSHRTVSEGTEETHRDTVSEPLNVNVEQETDNMSEGDYFWLEQLVF